MIRLPHGIAQIMFILTCRIGARLIEPFLVSKHKGDIPHGRLFRTCDVTAREVISKPLVQTLNMYPPCVFCFWQIS